MHEYSIIASLVARVAELADERDAVGVKAVHVRLGELSGVEPELLATAYRIFREGTVCEEAELFLTTTPIRWTCRGCEREIPAGEKLICECGGYARLSSGDEILLERVEMEVP